MRDFLTQIAYKTVLVQLISKKLIVFDRLVFYFKTSEQLISIKLVQIAINFKIVKSIAADGFLIEID